MELTRTKLMALAVTVIAALVVSGCDLQENASVDNGRELFIANCGSCHILAEAGTTGSLGPDLDAAFAASRSIGNDNDTIEGIVEYQIANPRRPAGPNPELDPTFMPAALVEGDEAVDISAYVASVAGVPGIMPPEAPGGPGGQVFANNGCGACHIFSPAGPDAIGEVGPNLDVVLAGQNTKQIEESIIDPEANISAGFGAGIMPATYGTDISPEDLALLVEFLASGAGR